MPDVTRTNDPNIAVESFEPGRVVYRDLTTGERWAELGECNRCGLCVSVDDPDIEWLGRIGEPGACSDRLHAIRPLYAVRPAWKQTEPRCSLSFEVLGD